MQVPREEEEDEVTDFVDLETDEGEPTDNEAVE